MSALRKLKPVETEDSLVSERRATDRSLLQQTRGDENTITQIRLLNMAVKAARFNSRPPVISALTGIKESTAKKIYKDVQGVPPPKGQLPGDAGFYTSGLLKHIESIWLLQTYKGLTFESDSNVEKVECTMLSYKLYLHRFPEPCITFDRFFLLIRLSIYGKHITTVNCTQCEGVYLVQAHHTYSSERVCPACELNAKMTKESELLAKSKFK